MRPSLEQAWRDISTVLDEVLDLDAPARQVWLAALRSRDPQQAERVRAYLLDLDKLESDNFLGDALPSRFLAKLRHLDIARLKFLALRRRN